MVNRDSLPRLSAGPFITDGGMETTLIFKEGLDRPHFAAFALLEDDAGRERVRAYFDPYLALARDQGAEEIAAFAETSVDMVAAVTMTYAEEAVGIVRAAQAAGLPVAVSFTVETDGRLPSGQSLREAIEEVDAETDGAAAYFMINCAHPTHFEGVLEDGAPWLERIGGLRANASTKSHAELDEAEELDEGDPADLGARYAALRRRLPNVRVVGGCCGTDERHIAEICRAWRASPEA